MKHRVLPHGPLGRVVDYAMSLQIDHFVASGDANHSALDATVVNVLLNKIIDFFQSFGGHADVFRASVR